MAPLVPCPSCRRHLREREESCPFCSSRLEPLAMRRYAAGVMLVMAAAALTGCPRSAPKYGGPPPPPETPQ
ncbi:MAG TPA: hypothetical protein VFB62_09385 [Polyangiaceae bacterium]|nr:hypothetical protein [Polyangiaceae bacterium]